VCSINNYPKGRSPGLLDDLRDRIRGIEASPLRSGERETISTGFPALNRLLVDGGLRRGALTEWVGEAHGSGAMSLGLHVAAHLLREEGTLVVIDEAGDRGDFYPVGAMQLGIPLDRTVVIRPDSAKSALWAWEQSLRCPGIAVTFGKINTRNDRAIRRLQMAAESSGGMGFLIPPPGHSGTAWAATRIQVEWASTHPTDYSPSRRLRLRVTRGQVGSREAAIEVELDDEASSVPAFSQLAGAMAIRDRAVG
jgi:protein ImuA